MATRKSSLGNKAALSVAAKLREQGSSPSKLLFEHLAHLATPMTFRFIRIKYIDVFI